MSKKLLAAPAAESVRLIPWTKAQVVPGFISNTWFLVVQGKKPYMNMKVRLSPRIYIQRPTYWAIEVVGTLHGIGLPAVAPYSISLDISQLLGTKGIEVIGSNKRKQIRVP